MKSRKSFTLIASALSVLGLCAAAQAQETDSSISSNGSTTSTTTTATTPVPAATTSTTTTVNTPVTTTTNKQTHSVYIGPQLGYQQARDADNGNLFLGAALRAKFVPAVGAEVSINWRQERFFNRAVTVTSWPVMLTGMFYPVPFLYGSIGGGWYNTTFDYDSSKIPSIVLERETKQTFGWHFGIGAEVPVGNVKLTADLRYVFINYDWQEVPGLSGLKSNFIMAGVGILFGI